MHLTISSWPLRYRNNHAALKEKLILISLSERGLTTV
jgi:hypothetical protein